MITSSPSHDILSPPGKNGFRSVAQQYGFLASRMVPYSLSSLVRFFCRHRISSLAGQNGTTASGQAVIVSPAVPILNRPVRKAEAIPFPQR